MNKTLEPTTGTLDVPFRCRSYGKAELAQMYLPTIAPASARRAFNEWIDFHPTLRHALLSSGLALHSKRYTPAQVRLIVSVLGEP